MFTVRQIIQRLREYHISTHHFFINSWLHTVVLAAYTQEENSFSGIENVQNCMTFVSIVQNFTRRNCLIKYSVEDIIPLILCVLELFKIYCERKCDLFVIFFSEHHTNMIHFSTYVPKKPKEIEWHTIYDTQLLLRLDSLFDTRFLVIFTIFFFLIALTTCSFFPVL